ncbi:hypothetical protein [Arthrobacter bambusae]|uniref:hypothetical protein n=1 Tax=Arthrobacter bambusae TaxID=1338426 RepID=UPI0027816F13|nr:hypothetical protein [Arthrobacter bambusae]MDQ0031457.1 hypothetical protein [Arthrobacter bambusae]MDQ0099655.1 hypothetical protein [Arthrobacter bambusae]
MDHVRNRLLTVGVLIIAGGVIFETMATNLLAETFSLQRGSSGNVGPLLIDFIVSLVRFGLAPLGASLVALGIAAHIIRDHFPTLFPPQKETE